MSQSSANFMSESDERDVLALHGFSNTPFVLIGSVTYV